MKESEIERYLVQAIKAAGGKCYKWVCPGNRGAPDRIVLFPGGLVAFVELKRPGAKVLSRSLQDHFLSTLRAMNFYAEVVSTKEQADAFVQQMQQAVCLRPGPAYRGR